LAIKSASTDKSNQGDRLQKIPDEPPPGTGNLTLADLCSRYNLNMKIIVRELNKQSIKAREDMTIKRIANDHQLSPMDIYEIIKTISSAKSS
jgi:hypothetical protein